MTDSFGQPVTFIFPILRIFNILDTVLYYKMRKNLKVFRKKKCHLGNVRIY